MLKSDSPTRTIVLLALWFLAAASCVIWGTQREWIAGLCITVISLTTLYWARFEEENDRDKQRYTMAGIFFLIMGLLLLYVGLAPLFQK